MEEEVGLGRGGRSDTCAKDLAEIVTDISSLIYNIMVSLTLSKILSVTRFLFLSL